MLFTTLEAGKFFCTSYNSIKKNEYIYVRAELCTLHTIIYVSPAPYQTLSYMKVTFSVDICSLANKVYHYIFVTRNSSCVQWSQLKERRNYNSKSGLEILLKSSLIERNTFNSTAFSCCTTFKQFS